jgi:glutamate-1-semialdehyde 2,1-aminomutase
MQAIIRREDVKLLPEKTFSLQRSEQLYEQAKRYLPAGASSNVRVHMHDPYPILFQRGDGPRVCDVDGNCYIDYLMSYGALILGHRHPSIVAGIEKQLQNGIIFGTTTELEIEVAKMVTSVVPCAELVSFANSGTEATMEAVRIARAATGKDKILKFEGHYHGHHDYVLFSVDSPSPVSGLESSPHKLPYFPGIPDEIAKTVIVAPWNNPTALERILKKNQSDVAAVITEPVMGSQGVIGPDGDYLKQLRELTIKYDSLLIFDEVLTGFRLAKGGAQEFYGVKPDLATFAKALGGGAPIAAVAGSRELLGLVGPGRIGFGGTYNAHPLSLAASKATLETLLQNDGEVFPRMASMGAKLKAGLVEAFKAGGFSAVVNNVGPMVSIYFTKLRKISTYRQALQSNGERFKRFRDEMLTRGVYMHPDGLERLSISAVHTEREIELTIAAAQESLKAMRTQTIS